MYYLYIVRCADRALYTGIARDVRQRVREHNSSEAGAKYTRSKRPVKLVYTRRYRNRAYALRAEARVKQMTRREKLALIKTAKR